MSEDALRESRAKEAELENLKEKLSRQAGFVVWEMGNQDDSWRGLLSLQLFRLADLPDILPGFYGSFISPCSLWPEKSPSRMVSPFCSRSRSRSRGYFHWWVRIDYVASARSSFPHCNRKSSLRSMDTPPNRRGSSHVQAVMCLARASPSSPTMTGALEYTPPLNDLYHENWHWIIERQGSKRIPCTMRVDEQEEG